MVNALPIRSVTDAGVVSSLAFAGCMWATCAFGQARVYRDARAATVVQWRQIAVGALAAIVFATSMICDVWTVLTWAGAAVYLGAFSEEFVFRELLPRRLLGNGASESRDRFVAAVLPQVSFALAHVVRMRGLPVEVVGHEVLRLVVAGLLFQALAQRHGIWLSAAVHAGLNLSVLVEPGGRLALGPAFVICGGFALMVIAIDTTRGEPPERRVGSLTFYISPEQEHACVPTPPVGDPGRSRHCS
ncbi:MAG TPA: CPBP family intramembrane glutamic endopeptidase [Gemmatimonadaceae bacterium]